MAGLAILCPPTYPASRTVHASKYALAAFIQGVASAFRHHLFEHASHCFYSIHQLIQLCQLSLGQRSAAFRGASDVAESKEQMSDFSQCETQLTRTLNDCQRVKRCGVVSSLPADSRGSRKQSNSLVITNRRCLESHLSPPPPRKLSKARWRKSQREDQRLGVMIPFFPPGVYGARESSQGSALCSDERAEHARP